MTCTIISSSSDLFAGLCKLTQQVSGIDYIDDNH